MATLCLAVWLTGCSTPAPNRPGSCPWTEQVAHVKEGMCRAEVEKVLPPYQGRFLRVRRGPIQIIKYWVDEHWMVSITYDFHGCKRDEKGNVLEPDSPENRVLLPAEIEARPWKDAIVPHER